MLETGREHRDRERENMGIGVVNRSVDSSRDGEIGIWVRETWQGHMAWGRGDG